MESAEDKKAPRGFWGLPWKSWGLLLATGALAFHPVTPTWSDNPNYSFGWGIPFVALFLFYERWETRPARAATSSGAWQPLLILWGVLFLIFRLASESDPDWRPGLWILAGLYLAAVGGWLWIYGGRPWLRHFAFPVGFLLLSLPWFFGIEFPLVQGLMRWNAVMVAESLRGLSIAATPAGNIIHLQNCDLGVEEACSGILSLQASLMMGCLLGEIYRLTVGRRMLLVLTSLALALLGNYCRTFFLAMMAFYEGPEAVTRWHDTAGYSILIFTGLGSWLAALAFVRGLRSRLVTAPRAPVEEKAGGDFSVPARTAFRVALAMFLAAFFAEVVTQGWFGVRESSLTRHPFWTAKVPDSTDLAKPVLSPTTRTALRCDGAETGMWRDARNWTWTVYWLQYDPKPYTRVVLGWHNPDNCLPSVGLVKDADYPNFAATVNGISFYVHPKRFRSGAQELYVFWIVYPNQGDLPPEEDTRVDQPVGVKFRTHLQDVWKGYRGVGVETMEVVLTGPGSYAEAKEGFLEELKAIVVPASAGATVTVGKLP